MGRDFVLNGECMIMCRGGAHMSGYPISYLSELGLSVDQVTITPTFHHRDVKVTGFGPDAAADLQVMLASVDISCTLIHYDDDVLDTLVDESLGNGGIVWPTVGLVPDDEQTAGRMPPTGVLLGKRLEMYASGNNFFSVNLLSPVFDFPWRFRRCCLARQPFRYPLGAGVSEVKVDFRALPYADPYVSGVSGFAFVDPTFFARGGVIRSGMTMSKRREVLGSGAVLWDRLLDTSGPVIDPFI